MKRVTYDVQGGCYLCLNCFFSCPVGAISIEEDVSVHMDQEKCIGCGRCYDNCGGSAVVRIEHND